MSSPETRVLSTGVKTMRQTKAGRIVRVVAAAATLLVTACQEYAARRDTIAFHAGEAAAHNKAVHIIDPWPAASARTDIDHHGGRAVRVMERYEAAGAPPPSPAPVPTIAVPVAAPR